MKAPIRASTDLRFGRSGLEWRMKRYYSPQIDRDLVSTLYHEAKVRGIPMTRLTNRLLHAALRYEGVEHDNQARKASGTTRNAPLRVRLC